MNVHDILRDRRVQTAAISTVSFVVGSGLGYMWAKKRFFAQYTVVVEEPPLFEQLVLDMDADPKSNVTVIPIHPQEDPVEEIAVVETQALKTVNVFTVEDKDWDYDLEVARRRPDQPYILHQEEFINDEMGFRQETVTYYEGDDIMADQLDTPIYNFSTIMGDLEFGHGSRDANVVYIRNETMQMEWEVLRHKGMFAHEVLGLELEHEAENSLKHSVLKFRRE